MLVLALLGLVIATHELSELWHAPQTMSADFDALAYGRSASSNAVSMIDSVLVDPPRQGNTMTDGAAEMVGPDSARDGSTAEKLVADEGDDKVAVVSTDEAERRAREVLASALERAARRRVKNRKGAALPYQRLLPLGAPPRRYSHGVSPSQLESFRQKGRKEYLASEAYWRAFDWQGPPPHESLLVFVHRLTPVCKLFPRDGEDSN